MAKPKPPREAEILRQCLQWLHAHGIFAWRANSGGMVGEHKGKKRFIRFNAVAGLADIIGCWKGRFLAIETKRPGAGPTLLQQIFLAQVREAGGLAGIVHSIEELQELLNEVNQ